MPTHADSKCTQPVEKLKPVIDRNRCEGKADCVAVCPYDVFIVRRLDSELAELSFLSRLKVRLHGGRQALTPNEEDCRACALCVSACPERAIRLVRREA